MRSGGTSTNSEQDTANYSSSISYGILQWPFLLSKSDNRMIDYLTKAISDVMILLENSTSIS